MDKPLHIVSPVSSDDNNNHYLVNSEKKESSMNEHRKPHDLVILPSIGAPSKMPNLTRAQYNRLKSLVDIVNISLKYAATTLVNEVITSDTYYSRSLN